MSLASFAVALALLGYCWWAQSRETAKWKADWHFCKRLLELTREQLNEQQRNRLEEATKNDEELKYFRNRAKNTLWS